MNKAPTWNLYLTFIEIVRDGSLSAAARRLGLTQPTAGRHVDALEQSLGVTLFTRSQRGLLPTQAALELLPHANAMAAAEAALRRAASGEAADVRGTVRLTASQVMSAEILPSILAGFCALHPRIDIEVSVSNTVQDLARRDADIAIRTARPTQNAIVAKRVGSLRIGLFAHKTYLAVRGTPQRLEDLARHRLIGFDRDATSFRAVAGSGSKLGRKDFGFRTDDDAVQIAAIRLGLGIGGCQTSIAAKTPGLVAILPADVSFKLDVWLAMHEDLRTTRRVRLMFDHLAEALTDHVRKHV